MTPAVRVRPLPTPVPRSTDFRPNPRACAVRDAYGTPIGELYMKRIDEVKALIRTAIADKELPADVSIWGIPLFNDRWSDTVIDKFLLARHNKPKKAMAMIRNTIKWREEFGIEALMEEDLGMPPEIERAVFMGSADDKFWQRVCYNVYGEFQNKDLYEMAFGDGEKRRRFLRWRIQCLEKVIRESLDFTLHGTSMTAQVFDLKDSPVPPVATDLVQFLHLLQDHYPELLEYQIFINVPRWFFALNKIISPFLSRRTKRKLVFARPEESADTLFNYILPEAVPVRLGGLEGLDQESNFTSLDGAGWDDIKPFSKKVLEWPVIEKSLFVWETRVLGWNVSVDAEFVPSAEGGYTVIIQRSKKFLASDNAIARYSFKVVEPGKVVFTVDNATSKKKMLIYRCKDVEYMESADPTELS